MEFRLSQRDHPHPVVNDCGLSHRDPYFRACWGALLDSRTTHLVARVAELTQQHDLILSLDQLSEALDPTPATRRVRLDTLRHTMAQAEQAGLAARTPAGRGRQSFCVYRSVPLLAEPSLRRLTDAELRAHADVLRDVNLRLHLAGHPQIETPDWVSERLRRAYPAAGLASTANTATPVARLEALRRPGPPTHAAPSL